MLVVELHIRIAVPADIDDLGDLFRRSSLSNGGDYASLVANPDALVFSDVSVHERRTRVAVRDSRLVGFATQVRVGAAVELDDLFVDPEYMRQGVGRALVSDVVATAQAGGVERVEVTANPHALAFYESVGFVHDGVIETRFGTGHRMRLEIHR